MDLEEADSLLKWSYEDVDSMGNENGSLNESIGAISKTNIVNTVTSQVSGAQSLTHSLTHLLTLSLSLCTSSGQKEVKFNE